MEQEVKELFQAYQDNNDLSARDKLVEKYMYVAEILAKKFVGRGVEYEDLLQIASFALVKGLKRFDPSLNLEFTTFITPTITGEIKNYFRDYSRTIKLPRKLSQLNLEINKVKNEIFSQTGKKPTAKEIADILSVSEEEILRAQEVSGTISLDATSDNSEEDSSRYDYIPDKRDFFEAFENKESILQALKELDETEQKLVSLRFVNELSQAETAKRLGVSQMFVSRMERKVLLKLKELLADCV